MNNRDEYIADDRLATPEYFEMLKRMTDEEFAEHLKRLEEQEEYPQIRRGD